MAPAAADTFERFFIESGFKPKDFDMIVTGDLGSLGSDIMRKLMSDRGYTLGGEYSDCGIMIYDNTQQTYQGGSGCGCSASVLNSFILQKLRDGELNRVLFAATGALMSLTSSQQGETIPGICHLVVIER